MNCKNGRAWLNISTYLGFHEKDLNGESSFPEEIIKPKKSRSSPSKIRQNRERAAAFREKKRQETQVNGCGQFCSMDSSADILQIDTKSENADESTSVNYDDSDTISSNVKDIGASDNLICELSEDQIIQQRL